MMTTTTATDTQEDALVEAFSSESEFQAYFLDEDSQDYYDIPGQEFPLDTPSAKDASSPNLSVSVFSSQDIPEEVYHFLRYFYSKFNDKNIYEMSAPYQNKFRELSEKYYSKQSWPPSQSIAEFVNNDKHFLALYEELYYRHIHSQLSISEAKWEDSFSHYKKLFKLLLESSESICLPNQWLWDIFDEFVFQFKLYHHIQVNKSSLDEEESSGTSSSKIWSIEDVVCILEDLVQLSNIKAHCVNSQKNPSNPDVTNALLRSLGYFGLVSLIQVFVLTGNFSEAINCIQNINFTKRIPDIPFVISCQISAYYYLGFAYFMSSKISEVVKLYLNVLLIINRAKQSSLRGYRYDNISKDIHRIYALLAICVSIFPSRLEDSIDNTLKEKFGEKLNKINSRIDIESTIKDLFFIGAPKFIHPKKDPYEFYFKTLYPQIATLMQICILKDILGSYMSIHVERLCDYLNVSYDEMMNLLVFYKIKNTDDSTLNNTSLEGLDTKQLLSKPYISQETDFLLGPDFYIENDFLRVIEQKHSKKLDLFFFNQIHKYKFLLSI